MVLKAGCMGWVWLDNYADEEIERWFSHVEVFHFISTIQAQLQLSGPDKAAHRHKVSRQAGNLSAEMDDSRKAVLNRH